MYPYQSPYLYRSPYPVGDQRFFWGLPLAIGGLGFLGGLIGGGIGGFTGAAIGSRPFYGYPPYGYPPMYPGVGVPYY